MNRLLGLLRWLLAALCLAVALPAQNIVFDDGFSADSLNSATYPAVGTTTTGWVTLSNKNAPASTIADRALTLNMAGTSSGFFEAQALFSPSVIRVLPGTYLELVATFIPTYVVTNSGDNLIVGLFNSNTSAPVAGLGTSGLSSTLTTFASGGAKGWEGYNANIPLTGASVRMLTRAAQTAANNTVQDVLIDSQSTSVGYSSPVGVSFSSVTGSTATVFTNGATYTVAYRVSLSNDGNTLTAQLRVFNGEGTSGIGANTLIGSSVGTVNGANIVTTSFDALAFGWRADAGAANPSSLKLTSVVVSTTGGAPWFITQPVADTMVSAGSDLTLVTSVGGNVANYQWQKSTDGGASFSPIDTLANPSAATASLTLTGAQSSDAGKYRLIATNAAGSTTSAVCTVAYSITPVAPSISTHPSNATALGGTSVTFTVVANGTAPLQYSWQKSTDGGVSFADLGGVGSSSYSIASVALADEGHYRVVVRNGAGEATSQAASLAVNQPLAITSQPLSATLAPGAAHTLTVGATGRPAPTYQWYLNGSAIVGESSASLQIASASGANNGLYTVLVSNAAGESVTSSAAAIAVVSQTLALTARTPSLAATGVFPDSRLTLTFNQPVVPGLSGLIRIHDASNSTTPVDTIDLAAATARMKTLRAGNTLSTQALPVQNKTIGGLTNFNYYPLTISGNTVTLHPRNGVLVYGKTYYVTIDAGAFTDASGLSWGGIADSSGWTFATKAGAPLSDAANLVVAADGSGDFMTLQGALDFIPSGNTTPRTILVRKGTYFEIVHVSAKHNLTILGEDRHETVIAYPNNNNFNNVGGSYHRMVLQADKANNFTLANLTVQNTTPKGGAQAEAVVINGNTTGQAILANLELWSYQDTLLTGGSCFVTDSHISGDVDFMWGGGPTFFNACRLTLLSSNAYLTQVRNGSTGRGFVYYNCTIDAPAGVTGNYLSRIDPNTGSFPYSEVVWLNCTVGSSTGGVYTTPVSGAGWLLNNTADQSASSAPNVHFWEYNSHYPDGTPLPVTSRIGASRQLVLPADEALITNYSTPSWVLGNGWTPAMAPLIASQPSSSSVSAGGAFTLSVQAVGIPAPTFQWRRNGVDIPGATSATYAVAASNSGDAGTYTVVVTSGAASVSSNTVAVLVANAAPVIALQPGSTEGLLGTTATFSVRAVGDGPFSYQWRKGGEPIPGATRLSLRLAGLKVADAGDYSVAVTNTSGTTVSDTATLNVVSPLSAVPTLPSIPDRVFDVTAYGAVGDGATDNTASIVAALAALSTAGGGTLEFPPAVGAYLSGPFAVGSGINLQVDAGAVLKALPFGTYPKSTTAPSHFITITSGSTDVELSGGGVIDGDGSAWWTQYEAGRIASRPRLMQINRVTRFLATGVTLRNSAMFHMAFSGANSNVTLHGITISAPGDSPNTDGIDYAGTDFLAQGCSVSVGDDNIVAKPGSERCERLVIAGCEFGTGHGVSVGGQTNAGLDGMTVMNCNFTGTDTALRLKADPTQGGPVRNVVYKDITMHNVASPILVYSYYSTIGTPGSTGGSGITPAKAALYNTTPPESLSTTTIPTWSDIRFSNITITGATNYSMIWGLPNHPVARVTLENISLSGVAGWRIYNAQDIRFTGAQTGTLSGGGPKFTTFNSCVFTSDPVVAATGNSVALTQPVQASSGLTAVTPGFLWRKDDVALTDGVQADGTTISGSTTATLTVDGINASLGGSFACLVRVNLDTYDPALPGITVAGLPTTQVTTPVVLSGAVGVAQLSAGDMAGDLTYQWQHYNSDTGLWEDVQSGEGVSGNQSRVLSLAGLSSQDDAALYRCVVGTGTIPRIGGEARLAVRASRLVNMSARASVNEGELVIPGFVTKGARHVLVRAIGPGLLPYKISEYLPDPVMTFYNGQTAVETSDDWQGALTSVFQSVGAFPLASGSKDAALVADIADQNSAYISSRIGGGVVLAEVYDTSKRGLGRLVNCSARATISDGDRILVAGFVIDGNVPLRMLIRAVGPGLDQFPGVTGTLPDPKIILYKGLEQIGTNDNWEASLEPLMKELKAFDITPGSKDAAMVATLEPGNYTVEVRSADGRTGNAIVELYEARQ